MIHFSIYGGYIIVPCAMKLLHGYPYCVFMSYPEDDNLYHSFHSSALIFFWSLSAILHKPGRDDLDISHKAENLTESFVLTSLILYMCLY